jgi:hypothetical protein
VESDHPALTAPVDAAVAAEKPVSEPKAEGIEGVKG